MDVYEGMIIGEGSREQDIAVNVCKGKNLTNVRAAAKDDTVRLKTPREMSLEECIAFLNDDIHIHLHQVSVCETSGFLLGNLWLHN